MKNVNRLMLFFFGCMMLATSLYSKSKPTGIEKKLKTIWKLEIRNAKKKQKFLTCEVAITLEEKSRGLMFRKKLPWNSCMIFVYEEPQLLQFWMKSTSIPLAIAYVSDKNTIMEIHEMTPFSEKIIASTMKVKYAIEVNRKWFRKNAIYVGEKIHIIKD